MSADCSARLQDAVAAALAQARPLRVAGGGSKAFYGQPDADATALDVTGHRGIVHYQPSELVLTARCGTPLAEIETTLAEQRQMLGFEPPHFAASATFGGCIASGLSGPRRPFAGAARDFVLGCRIINGHAEILKFGGETIKNVAGFDVSRLMVGALGTLGILLEISVKVLPRPEQEQTRRFALELAEAQRLMLAWQRQCLPLSGLCYADGSLWARLEGNTAALTSVAQRLGGEEWPAGSTFWQDLREQRLAFFHGDLPLWRIVVPPATPPLPLSGTWLYDWGGALRWLRSDEPALAIIENAAAHGGHARCFRGADRQPAAQPEALARLSDHVKQAFDPQGLFNPGLLL